MQLKNVLLLCGVVVIGLLVVALSGRAPILPNGPGGPKGEHTETAQTVQEALAEAQRQLADLKAHPEKYLPPKKTSREKAVEWFTKRPVKPPLLAWLFDESGHYARQPIGGSLVVSAQAAGSFALDPSGTLVPSPSGYVCFEGARLLSTSAGEALCDRIRTKGAFSMELIVQPSHLRHRGPARIASLSWDGNNRNFTFAQDEKRWVVRLRTSDTDANGTKPEVRLGEVDGTRAHVVVTYDGTQLKAYLNGYDVTLEQQVHGSLENWEDNFPLVLGNEAYAARPWAGAIRWVAFYDRALNPDEVNHCVGHLPPGDPKPGQLPPEAPSPPDGHAPAGDTDF